MVGDCSDEYMRLWYAAKDKSWEWRCQKGDSQPVLVSQGGARVPGPKAPLAPTSVGSPAHRGHVTHCDPEDERQPDAWISSA